MPRRSNPFQRLAASITFAVKGFNYKVEESVLDKNPKTGSIRELDILLTNKKDQNDRILIECRDHKRPQNVQWLDSLIGKAQILGYKKVVAVSSSGFTRSALSDGQELGVELLTLKAAEERNWQGLFSKLQQFTVEIVHKPILTSINLKGKKKVTVLSIQQLFLKDILIFNKKLNKSRLLKDHVFEIIKNPSFLEFIKNNVFLFENTSCGYEEIFRSGWFYQFRGGSPEKLESIIFIVRGGIENINFPLKGYSLGGRNVLVGDYDERGVVLYEEDGSLIVALEQNKRSNK